MNEYYVYVYLDVRKSGNYVYEDVSFEYEPFYVGKGCGDRCYTHLEESYDAKNDEHRHRKIRKIIQESGKEPEILKVKNDMSAEDALVLETHLIKIIGREDLHKGPLLNKTDGGEGLINPGIETRKKFSAIRKEWMSHPENKERIFTKQRGAKISKALSGKKKSPNHIAKLPQNKIGYKHDNDFAKKISQSLVGNARAVGNKHSEETKQLLRVKSSGKNNAMYGKSVKEVWTEKYGIDVADEMWLSANEKRKKKQTGQKKSPEWKKKLSEAAKKRWRREREKIISNNEEVEI